MKFLTSIRPSVIAKRATKKLGAAKNFIGGRSSFFNRGASSAGGSGLGGIAQGKVKPAPNGISNLISNISQTITGGDTNNININKLLGDKLSQFTDKISSGMQVPNLDGLMSSVSGISDFMKSFTDPTALNGITEGFQSVKSSLQETVDLATTVRKVLGKLIKQVNAAPSGGGGGGAGGLLSAGAGLVGAGIAGAAGVGAARKGLGFAKFLASKKSLAMIGLGAAGGAALGAGNAAEAADISTQMRMTDVQPTGGMPADQIALFNSTVERFDKYLEDAKTKQKPTGGGKTSKGTKTQKPPGPGPSGGKLDAASVLADTAEEKAFIATVREAEGTAGKQGYNTVYGGAVVPELTQMTLQELYDASKLGGTNRLPARLGGGVIPYAKDQYNSSASGAAQLMPDTLKGLLDRGTFKPTDVFDEKTQNAIILHLARSRGVNIEKMDRASMQKANKIWAGLGPEYGQTSRTIDQSLQMHRENLSEARKSTAAAAAASAVLNTNVSANTNLQPTYNTTLADAFDPTNPANTGGGGISVFNIGGSTPRQKAPPKPAQPGNSVAPIAACAGFSPITAAQQAIYNIACAAR